MFGDLFTLLLLINILIDNIYERKEIDMNKRWMEAGISMGIGTLLVILFLGIIIKPAKAKTITICASGCDYTLIQQAVNYANVGDTLLLATGTYTENITIPISLTIQGEDVNFTIINGNGEITNQRVISITQGAVVTITDVTITNGRTANGVSASGDCKIGNPGVNGGGIYNIGTLTLKDSLITNNHSGVGGNGSPGVNCGGTGGAGGAGGGIYNQGILFLVNTIISSNTTGAGGDGGDTGGFGTVGGNGGNGGGIYNAGSLTLHLSEMISNTTGTGGKGGNNNSNSIGGAGGAGGSIYNSGTLTITHGLFRANKTGPGGYGFVEGGNGGIGAGLFNSGSISCNESQIHQNAAGDGATTIIGGNGGSGAGIYNAGTFHITYTSIQFNVSGQGGDTEGGGDAGDGGDGGGIFNIGTLLIDHSQINNNDARSPGSGQGYPGISGQGGGIYNSKTLTMTNSTLDHNQAGSGGETAGDGGGLLNTGTALITLCTLSYNAAGNGRYDSPQGLPGGNGGGITNFGTLTVTNSTISNNKAGTGGGGSVYQGPGGLGGGIYNTGQSWLANTTISQNRSGPSSVLRRGGGIVNQGTAHIQNTLIADNDLQVEYTEAPDCAGEFISGDYNLVGNDQGCTILSLPHDQIGSSNLPVNPKLHPLGNYGGPTQTHALQMGSPVLDTGNPAIPGSGNGACEAVDQRGITRPLGSACDIGAYEADPMPDLSITKIGPAQGAPGLPITYTITITNQGALTATNLIISDTLPINAFYIPSSGGNLQGNTVVWNLLQLAPGGGVEQVSFTITATETTVNLAYWVTAEGGFQAVGERVVTTLIEYTRLFLPIMIKP